MYWKKSFPTTHSNPINISAPLFSNSSPPPPVPSSFSNRNQICTVERSTDEMMSRSEKIKLIVRAILYIIAVTLYCMFREMKQKAMAALPNLTLFKHSLAAASTNAYEYTPTPPFSMSSSHMFMVNGSPSVSPIPSHIVTGAIKLSLPMIRYEDFLLRKEKDEEESGNGCVVCWECVERSDEIRDLANCRHVFHRGCLDRWVDEGQITCPLCRSMLLPPFTNPWAVVRESNSASDLALQEQEQQQIISEN